jgi:hypothetical protein
MATSSLVGQVHELSKKLAEAVELMPGEDLFAPKGRQASSFLYELMVLGHLLLGLEKGKWRIRIENRRNGAIVFARAPRPKSNATYFRVSRKKGAFHLVQGTQIRDRHGKRRAPDLSLQSEDSEHTPTWKHVLGFWDAKLRGNSGQLSKRRVTDSEYARFQAVRRWLRPPRPGTPRDVLGKWPMAFQVCALITNGKPPSEPKSVLLEDSVSVAAGFSGCDTVLRPTRLAHIRHARKGQERSR